MPGSCHLTVLGKCFAFFYFTMFSISITGSLSGGGCGTLHSFPTALPCKATGTGHGAWPGDRCRDLSSFRALPHPTSAPVEQKETRCITSRGWTRSAQEKAPDTASSSCFSSAGGCSPQSITWEARVSFCSSSSFRPAADGRMEKMIHWLQVDPCPAHCLKSAPPPQVCSGSLQPSRSPEHHLQRWAGLRL